VLVRGMTSEDLGLLLELELPLPDPMVDRDSWRLVMHRRYDRAAEFGFDPLDVVRCACDEKRARLYRQVWR
jgi:hypothetical protein